MKSGDVLFAVIALALCLQGCGREGTADQQAAARVDAESHGPTQGPVASVAAAEVLVAPLVTCDARLAASPRHTAKVEVY